MRCAESLKVQAYFDGEVDAPSALVVERHLEGCADCRALLEDFTQARALVQHDFSAMTAGAALRSRIARSLNAQDGSRAAARRSASAILRSRPFWIGVFGGAGSAALAGAFAWLLLTPLASAGWYDNIVAEHVASLLPGHLIAVESSDQHTVKPWFAGHADVSPLVEDFSKEGFRLIGGRADYLAEQRVAVTVYQHGLHVINVFSWKRNSRIALRDTTRSGYHLAFWSVGDLQYCAVSDMNWLELQQLERLIRTSSDREQS